MTHKDQVRRREYHREYMKMYSKTHKLTPEQKLAKAERDKNWRLKNKEKLAEYQHQRWLRDKDKIVLRKKKYAELNPDKIHKQAKESYERNIESRREGARKYYVDNKVKIRVYKKEYSRSPRGRFKSYSNRARVRNLEFSLTENQFYELLSQDCHYCGDEQSYGIDRKDSSVGYTKENSLPCCKMCNFMKRDLDYDLFIDKVKKIVEKHS